MSDAEMERRIGQMDEISTLTQGVRNRIVSVGPKSVTVVSDRTGTRRTIKFSAIRSRSTSHGCIIDAFRLALRIE